jgi:ArsR family transcriptional regulator
MDVVVDQLKALGEPNRFRIMMMLRIRPLCVCELLEVLDVSGATLSSHLKTLKYASLVESRRDGKWIEYRLASDARGLIASLYEKCEDRVRIDEDASHLARIDRSVCSVK